MTTLLYRGNNYVQHKHPKDVEMVELKYRKNIYKRRINKLKDENPAYIYRGNIYIK